MFIKKKITRRHIIRMYESVTYVHIDKDNYIVHTYTNKTTREKPFLNSVYNFVNRLYFYNGFFYKPGFQKGLNLQKI
jgi:hypothetical protein